MHLISLPVQCLEQLYLLPHGKFFPLRAFLPQAHSATVIAAPLAKGAIGAGVFFGFAWHVNLPV
jgi:hypothetical protein